jgi:hypothetical protein
MITPPALSPEQQKLIDRLIELDEFTRLEDGFLHWFPSGTGGGFSDLVLDTISIYLKQQNQQISDDIDRDFAGLSG